MAKQESHEQLYYHKIVESLMKFLKLYKSLGLETDFTVDQLIGLTSIFQSVIKTKSILLKRLLRIWDNLYHSKADKVDPVVQRLELKAAMGQIACLKEFAACVNLEVIAKRLSSPKVRVEVQLNGGNGRNLVVPSQKKKENKYSESTFFLVVF